MLVRRPCKRRLEHLFQKHIEFIALQAGAAAVDKPAAADVETGRGWVTAGHAANAASGAATSGSGGGGNLAGVHAAAPLRTGSAMMQSAQVLHLPAFYFGTYSSNCEAPTAAVGWPHTSTLHSSVGRLFMNQANCCARLSAAGTGGLAAPVHRRDGVRGAGGVRVLRAGDDGVGAPALLRAAGGRAGQGCGIAKPSCCIRT